MTMKIDFRSWTDENEGFAAQYQGTKIVEVDDDRKVLCTLDTVATSRSLDVFSNELYSLY
jgi:hypothetical protein